MLSSAVPEDSSPDASSWYPYLPSADLREAQRNSARIVTTLPDGSSAWLVLRHSLARKVLTDPRFSADMTRPGFPAHGTIGAESELFAKVMIRQDGADHRRLRRVLTPYFTPGEVQAYVPLIDEAVAAAVGQLRREGPPADVAATFARRIPTDVMCTLLGLPDGMRDTVLANTPTVFEPGATFDDRRAAFSRMEESMSRLLDLAAGGGPGFAFVGRLLGDVDDGRLDRSELQAMLMHLVIAGHHTTGGSLGLAVRQVLGSRGLRDAVTAGEEEAAKVVDELLRLNSVVRGAPRRLVLERVDIDGMTFEEGDGVIVALHSTNHDPAVFEAPGEVRPDRDNLRRHLAFGFGPHQCLGQALARKQITLALRTLLGEFPDMRLVDTGHPGLTRDNSTVSLIALDVTW